MTTLKEDYIHQCPSYVAQGRQTCKLKKEIYDLKQNTNYSNVLKCKKQITGILILAIYVDNICAKKNLK